MKTLIKNGRLVLKDSVREGWLLLEDGKIAGMGEGTPSVAYDEVLDADGAYVAPGLIDLHTHGAGGADFMDGTVEAYLTASRMQARHGATLVCPTTLTSTNEILFESFATYEKAQKENREGAAFGGMHLEGPYFSKKQGGAQDPRYLRNPRPEEYLDILSRTKHIARWSFAPELEGAPEFAAELSKRGIIASIGHTDATFEDCDAAYRSGSRLMTHFFSCMSTITRRNAYRVAGVLEYGYYQDGMTLEIIADGDHVPESLLKMIVKIKGTDRIVLVTDSMRAAGMPEGPSILGGLADGQSVFVEKGVAFLPDRSGFAGSVATADRLLRTMTRKAGCTLPEAVKMGSYNPAREMGILSRKGSLEVGKDADVILFDEDITILYTIIGGNIIYQK